ncbi:hypothetical protein L1987_62943 [Smallanthus sonchifolius]|uniref:Uncharacterized protein n=2 Tax=Smallanthus sonchifolius TaxID=185202 RepID=A0ACB9CC35_9ASTR|nr:hypothetical protein L1987_62937 [Smallanthus sonchifolius]KAI3731754.1 hypothetical protein L1987_62943 [Smallanthus sonchifolius]
MEIMNLYKWIASSCGVAMVVVVACTILKWVWVQPRRLERHLRLQGINGTSYKLLFGDTKEMRQMAKEANQNPIKIHDDIIPRVMPFVYQATKTYGNMFFTWFGPTPVVHVLDPGLAKDILSRINDFQKLRKSNPYVKIMFQGLIDYDGEKWFKHRKIINPAFHAHKFKYMAPAIHSSCTEMMDKWRKLLGFEHSNELDVHPYLQTLSSDIISRAAFGSNYEEGRRIFELQKELITLVLEIIRHSVYVPGSRFLPTKKNKRIKEIDQHVKGSIREIINKRLMAMDGGQDDLLGILLESNQKETQQISIEDVIEECKLFYFAGQETTSNLLVWSMILLSQHQCWQEQARDEVLHVTMILHEVLRLYPAVLSLYRITKEDTKLGKMSLPARTAITVPVVLLHHDHETWGHDANEFKPERFSEGVLKATKGQMSYFPFGWGPRICIGQNFAMMEAKIVLVMILQHFSFVLSSSNVHAPRSIITLQPQFGAHLIIKCVDP